MCGHSQGFYENISEIREECVENHRVFKENPLGFVGIWLVLLGMSEKVFGVSHNQAAVWVEMHCIEMTITSDYSTTETNEGRRSKGTKEWADYLI